MENLDKLGIRAKMGIMNDYARVMEAYKRLEERLKDLGICPFEDAEGGIWRSTPFEHVIPFVEYAKDEVFVPPGPTVIAGSGDGRESVIYSLLGLGPTINIELDGKFIAPSEETIGDLVGQGVLSEDNGITTVQGDFTSYDLYGDNGFPFEGIKYFCTTRNKSLGALVEMIRDKSPEGTKLVVYGLFLEEKDILDSPLEHLDSFKVMDPHTYFITYIK